MSVDFEIDDLPPEYSDGDETRFRGIVADADLADFIKRPKTAVAREYEKKTASILNAAMRGTISSPSTVADAAAIIQYGEGVSAAAGEWAQEDEKARKMIDLIATPSSPVVMFVMAAIPLVAQIIRNHESEVTKPVREVSRQFRIPFIKKNVSIGMRLKFALPKRFRNATVPPELLMEGVFSHPEVIKALKKRGIEVAGRK